MCHIEHMITISIRDLQMNRGDWIRKAAGREGIVVLDRRHPVAGMIPYSESERGLSFSQRTLVKGVEGIRRWEID